MCPATWAAVLTWAGSNPRMPAKPKQFCHWQANGMQALGRLLLAYTWPEKGYIGWRSGLPQPPSVAPVFLLSHGHHARFNPRAPAR